MATIGSTRRVSIAIAGVLALVAAGLIGYVIGHQPQQVVTVRQGLVYSSASTATVRSAGWYYDVPIDVPWFDSQGTIHYGGRPSCLPVGQKSWIVFGSVDTADINTRSVVWVRC
jgi:hypothetical protein